jgi:hypothetical protein
MLPARHFGHCRQAEVCRATAAAEARVAELEAEVGRVRSAAEAQARSGESVVRLRGGRGR